MNIGSELVIGLSARANGDGNKGHLFLMNGIAILFTIASVYIIGLVYGWQHFVLHLDDQKPNEKKKSV